MLNKNKKTFGLSTRRGCGLPSNSIGGKLGLEHCPGHSNRNGRDKEKKKVSTKCIGACKHGVVAKLIPELAYYLGMRLSNVRSSKVQILSYCSCSFYIYIHTLLFSFSQYFWLFLSTFQKKKNLNFLLTKFLNITTCLYNHLFMSSQKVMFQPQTASWRIHSKSKLHHNSVRMRYNTHHCDLSSMHIMYL